MLVCILPKFYATTVPSGSGLLLGRPLRRSIFGGFGKLFAQLLKVLQKGTIVGKRQLERTRTVRALFFLGAAESYKTRQ